MSEKHPNSKIIKIYRAGSFIEDAQAEGAAEFMSMSNKAIGSYYASNSGTAIGTGLSFEEQDILMPYIVNMPKTDPNFRKAIAEYFSSLTTKIPYGTGRDFEIGLREDNNKAISETNQPLNLDHFIRYRHALGHPRVANSRERARGNQLMEFYIFDKSAVEERQVKENNERDEALALYLSLKKEPAKVDAMLTLLGTDPREFSGANAKGEKDEALSRFATTSPRVFLSTHKTNFFEERYTLQTMVNVGALKKVGAQYVVAETGQSIGHDVEEAIYFLKDEKNADLIQLLKVRMQEGLKKKVNPKKPAKQMPTTARG